MPLSSLLGRERVLSLDTGTVLRAVVRILLSHAPEFVEDRGSRTPRRSTTVSMHMGKLAEIASLASASLEAIVRFDHYGTTLHLKRLRRPLLPRSELCAIRMPAPHSPRGWFDTKGNGWVHGEAPGPTGGTKRPT